MTTLEQREIIHKLLDHAMNGDVNEVIVREPWGEVQYVLEGYGDEPESILLEFADFGTSNPRGENMWRFVRAIGFLSSIPKMSIALKEGDD